MVVRMRGMVAIARATVAGMLLSAIACEPPMMVVDGHLSGADSSVLHRARVEVSQFDQRRELLGIDTARVWADGMYSQWVVRSKALAYMRLVVSAPGYQDMVDEVPVSKDMDVVRRDFVLHR
jgi:hypothetical protein